jgi:Ala-tRNA(Pro) deacylase
MPDILDRIRSLLAARGFEFREIHHAPTRTSEESARARGEPLSIGGKAILLKVDDSFKLFVFSASDRIDSGKVKRRFHAKRIRFATQDELKEITGLVPGSVPPFGKPFFSLDLFLDTTITRNSRIAFNAGTLTNSVIMNVQDYLEIARPVVFDFSK